MDLQHNEEVKKKVAGQWLRWSEYGVVLAIIPGLFLSILTGQFAFVASPLTFSLGLNLFRRQSRDRTMVQLIQAKQQKLMNRYESVLESTKRERAEFLIEHAGELELRDHPQLMQVIEFRLQCLEKNRQVLQTYVDESCLTLDTSLRDVRDVQDEQELIIEQLTQSFEAMIFPEFSQQDIRDQLEAVSDRVESLMTIQIPVDQIGLRDLESRLVNLEHFLEGVEPHSVTLQHPDIQPQWSVIEQSIISRLDQLKLQVVSESEKISVAENLDYSEVDAQLDAMHRVITNQVNEWESWHQDKGYTLQRLSERLMTLTQNLEQTYQAVVESSMESEQTLMQSQFSSLSVDEIDVLSELDLESLKTKLANLQTQLNDSVPSLEPMAITSILDQTRVMVGARIEQLDAKVRNSPILRQQDQLDMLLTPLLQHISDCDDKLSRIFQARSMQKLAEMLAQLEARTETLAHQCESLQTPKSNELVSYDDLHVQLSTLRYKAEELTSQVSIELGQISYAIDNYLRQKYPMKNSSQVFR